MGPIFYMLVYFIISGRYKMGDYVALLVAGTTAVNTAITAGQIVYKVHRMRRNYIKKLERSKLKLKELVKLPKNDEMLTIEDIKYEEKEKLILTIEDIQIKELKEETT